MGSVTVLRRNTAMMKDSEADLLKAVIELSAELGLLHHHCRDSRYCDGYKGLPDLIVAGEHGILFRELKNNYSDTTPGQDLWGWTLMAPVRLTEIMAKQHRCSQSEITLALHYPAKLWSIWRPEDWDSGLIRKEMELIK